MKNRIGFVSNSSSTSFMITNHSPEPRSLVDFVRENPDLLKKFLDLYDWYKVEPRFTHENMVYSAIGRDISWDPGETRECVFGDEDGTLVGLVFDYILRDGGSSESFSWQYHEALR